MTSEQLKIRWDMSKTPSMNGHMHIDVWVQNYLSKLPKIRMNMMYKIRGKFERL